MTISKCIIESTKLWNVKVNRPPLEYDVQFAKLNISDVLSILNLDQFEVIHFYAHNIDEDMCLPTGVILINEH